jgi:hypothetical protein
MASSIATAATSVAPAAAPNKIDEDPSAQEASSPSSRSRSRSPSSSSSRSRSRSPKSDEKKSSVKPKITVTCCGGLCDSPNHFAAGQAHSFALARKKCERCNKKVGTRLIRSGKMSWDEETNSVKKTYKGPAKWLCGNCMHDD